MVPLVDGEPYVCADVHVATPGESEEQTFQVHNIARSGVSHRPCGGCDVSSKDRT